MKYRIEFLVVSTALILCALAEAQTRMAPEDIPEAGRFEFDGKSLVLPLAESGSHPMISVELGDGEEYRFIVDTGASVHVMDNVLAEKLGYKVTGEMSIGAPGGRQVPGNIVEVPTFSASTATIRGAEFVTMDISGLTGGLSQGVIGLALFRDHLLTYNLGQQEIIVSREELSKDDPGVMAYAAFHGKIQFDMDVAGVKVPSHLDTGSMGEFMLPAEIIASLPLQGPVQEGPEARMVGGPRKTSFATLEGNIRFAGLEFANPKVTFMHPSTGFGNIGGGIYGRYVMSIDQRNNLIAFRKPTGSVAAKPSKGRRTLGIGFRGMGPNAVLEIASVAPDSLAAVAGFEVGDKLVGINGRPASEFSMPDLGKLFGSAEPLRLEIERKGVAKLIEIQ